MPFGCNWSSTVILMESLLGFAVSIELYPANWQLCEFSHWYYLYLFVHLVHYISGFQPCRSHLSPLLKTKMLIYPTVQPMSRVGYNLEC
jgi:hypothetical protein